VKDIPFIRSSEDWHYLAVGLDLLARQVVGWSTSSRIDLTFAINGPLMAGRRREPENTVMAFRPG